MAEVHDGTATDGFAVPLRLHNLLLALAGRLDDSALSEARELVVRSRLDEAVELTTGALIAGRVPVSAGEQRELALVLEFSRSDATLADQLKVEDDVPAIPHRFSGENEPERGVADAIERTVSVLPDLRSVHAVWRNTPAGSVPGPLPQRVVLVDIGPEGNPPAVAYRVDSALRRAGIRAVVEVSGPTAERSDYRDSALGSASAVWLAGKQVSGPSAQPAAVSSSASGSSSAKAKGRHTAGSPAARHEIAESASEPEPEPVTAIEPESAQEPEPEQAPAVPSEPEPPAPSAPMLSAVPSESFEPSEPSEPSEPPAPSMPPGPPAFADYENRVESTADLSSAEVAQLRAALAEDPEKGKAIAAARFGPNEVVELPDLDLNDPQLSERDRRLLRELHAELAERERAEAAKIRLNGRGGEPADTRWVDGFSGA
ncbi:hypothetical protein [Amycolatopsis minnesotensis]